MSAGGMTYHLRARRYSDRQWRTFRAYVATWLSEWKPQTENLIIFGSSAGYTLNADFLQRFDRIAIVEPDAIARFLFKRRFPRSGAQTLPARHLLENLDLAEWREFVAAHPDTAFLFSNVVGQMVHIGRRHGKSVEERVAGLFEILAELKVRWASYHDILSTSALPHSLIPFVLNESKDTLESVAEEKFRGGRVKVTDHGTLDATYAVESKIACAWWEIEPLRYHLIGWIRR